MTTRFLFVVFIGVLTGCVHLKAVNELSSQGVKTTDLYEELPLTFEDYCIQRCQDSLINNSRLVLPEQTTCPCSLYDSADHAMNLIQRSLSSYFKGLEKLSAKKLTDYNWSPLESALTNKNYGPLAISKSTADAYTSLGGTITSAITGMYRRKKIANYIAAANAPVQVLLQSLQLALMNLSTELEVHNLRLQNTALALVNDPSLSAWEKRAVTTTYYDKTNSNSSKQKQIEAYQRALGKLAAAHQKLFENKEKLNEKEIREAILNYASILDNTVRDFRKIKSS